MDASSTSRQFDVFVADDNEEMVGLPGLQSDLNAGDAIDFFYNPDGGEWWCTLPSTVTEIVNEWGWVRMRLAVVDPYDDGKRHELEYVRLGGEEGVFYLERPFKPRRGVVIDPSKVALVPDTRMIKYIAVEDTRLHPPRVVLLTVDRWRPDDISAWRLYDGTWGDFARVPIVERTMSPDSRLHISTASGALYKFVQVSEARGRVYAWEPGERDASADLSLQNPGNYDFREEDGRMVIAKR